MSGARAALHFFGVPDAERRAEAYARAKQQKVVALIEAGEFSAYDDALRFVLALRGAGIRMAAASSSKNAALVLEKVRLGPGLTLLDALDADVSGRDLAHGKPHPEIFLVAARELDLPPRECFVVEDAVSGIQAAKAGAMAALGVARAGDVGPPDRRRRRPRGHVARRRGHRSSVSGRPRGRRGEVGSRAMGLQDVEVTPLDPERFRDVLSPEGLAQFEQAIARGRELLDGSHLLERQLHRARRRRRRDAALAHRLRARGRHRRALGDHRRRRGLLPHHQAPAQPPARLRRGRRSARRRRARHLRGRRRTSTPICSRSAWRPATSCCCTTPRPRAWSRRWSRRACPSSGARTSASTCPTTARARRGASSSATSSAPTPTSSRARATPGRGSTKPRSLSSPRRSTRSRPRTTRCPSPR